ncbi:MAG: zinc-dependent peptidase [Burkholderiales bacterium]|nr:zinc-dependent peptidase [Burkholderiales bacterium]
MSLFSRVAAWRRDRLLRRHAFPDSVWEDVLAQYPFFDRLDDAERSRLRELATLFCADKEFAGAGGLALTRQIQVAIAAQACLPVLRLDLSLYAGWHGVVVYGSEVVARRTVTDDDGVVHEFDEVISGEAMPGGPVVLSWEDVAMAGSAQAPAYNVVIHEFAHKIDMLKGEATGVPPFLPRFHAAIDARGFAAALASCFEQFAAAVGRWEDAGARERDAPRIDPYAASHPAEFFAVLSEVFFTRPADVLAETPALYPLLCAYYRQDPLGGRPVGDGELR